MRKRDGKIRFLYLWWFYLEQRLRTRMLSMWRYEVEQKRFFLMIAVLTLCLSMGGLFVYAEQYIYVEVSDFKPALSQFGEEVAGNMWVETEEEGALFGTIFGSPGDNDHAAAPGEPYLVIKLPKRVEKGESSKDVPWAAWGRFLMPTLAPPEKGGTDDGPNSFYLRMSPDAETWTPENRGDNALRWNDPEHPDAIFPDVVNGEDVILTDQGDAGDPWIWFNVNGAGTALQLEEGTNYCEIGTRESDPDIYPRIDVICFRNDGQFPSDAEALEYLEAVRPVEPGGKLAVTWSMIKTN